MAVQAAMGNIHSWRDVGKAALAGAAGGATLAAGGMILGAIGIQSAFVMAAGELLVVAGSGYVQNGVSNTLNGQSFNQNGWQSAALSAATFGVLKHGGPHIANAMGKIPGIKPAVAMLRSMGKSIPFADKVNSYANKFSNWYNEIYNQGVRELRGAMGRPSITAPYQRPRGATTSEQRAAVQGQPCVDCGQTSSTMFADHKTPLVKEYYETGKIDIQIMREVDSVQAHCPTCSGRQGAGIRGQVSS